MSKALAALLIASVVWLYLQTRAIRSAAPGNPWNHSTPQDGPEAESGYAVIDAKQITHDTLRFAFVIQPNREFELRMFGLQGGSTSLASLETGGEPRHFFVWLAHQVTRDKEFLSLQVQEFGVLAEDKLVFVKDNVDLGGPWQWYEPVGQGPVEKTEESLLGVLDLAAIPKHVDLRLCDPRGDSR
ncbi:MAG: hypothetical protein AAFU85_15210 [Planctomycetota bacterium]